MDSIISKKYLCREHTYRLEDWNVMDLNFGVDGVMMMSMHYFRKLRSL